jgi:hypothetical protein
MAQAAPFIMMAMAAVSAVASMQQADAQQEAADLEKQQYEDEKENARVAALQEEAERRKDLADVLSTQDAIRAGRGTELYSPTSMNLRSEAKLEAERDVDMIKLNSLNRQRRFGLGASIASSRGDAAQAAGIANAAGSIGSAAGKMG